MRLVVLGGSGAMARSALTVLAGLRLDCKIVVADIASAAAEEVATQLRGLGQAAVARRIDVLDAPALRRLLSDADLVVNAVGPYFRFGPPVLRAAIETGTDYLDICDDPEPTLEMLSLDRAAKKAGVTAVIGAGASPGLMNIFAQIAAEHLDEVEDVIVGWTLDNPQRGWDMMRSTQAARTGGGDAAAVHFFEQFTGTVPVIEHGVVTERRTRQPIAIAIDGFGAGTGYTVGHPEPVTLPTTLGALGKAVSVCMMSTPRAAVLHEIGTRIDRCELTVDAAARHLAGDVVLPEDAAARFADAGDLPIYFAVLTGRAEGVERTSFVGCVTKPESMLEGTGAPFAIAIAEMVRAGQRPAGVLPLDAVIPAQPYLDGVARLWGVAPGELYFSGFVEGTAVRI